MFEECVIRGRRFAPARFSAPLVGYTHSAYRRLLAELGGCGAIWTEMISARQVLSENFATSPWVRRRPHETTVVYQLMVNTSDKIQRVLEKLQSVGVDALDLNLACHARAIRTCAAGSALFEDFDSLRRVLTDVRKAWPHVLTSKIRLGHDRPGWQDRFLDRIKLLEDSGVDALVLHPRFFEEKFKRRARHELFPWASSLTRLPLIANGDLNGPETLLGAPQHFEKVSAVMFGRMAIVRPWLFSAWDAPGIPDLAAIWRKMHQYISEDFSPVQALRRLQMFTKYFAANFKFGHAFNVRLGQAATLEEILARADQFFAANPAILTHPSVAGL